MIKTNKNQLNENNKIQNAKHRQKGKTKLTSCFTLFALAVCVCGASSTVGS